MTDDGATVRCFGRVAGTVRPDGGRIRFDYDAEWIAGNQPPLSHSLPLDGDFGVEQSTAFFGGLLPEGAPRSLLARRLGTSPANDYALLTALGGDTAGAISVDPGGAPATGEAGDDVEWLTDDGVAVLIDGLPTRPMHADQDGEWRLSLAGAQDKLPVVVAQDGTIGLTRGRTPSTHILKTPIARLDDTVANEAFCLRLGGALDASRRSGFRTVHARPIDVLGREALLVRRYDRALRDGTMIRLHQEDLCQALGIPTAQKYESDGGPGVTACVDVLRAAGDGPSVPFFVDHLTLSFLVGNHDAHGKNFSLLYREGVRRAALAPAYDVLSTVAYHRTHDLTRKMAMQIGGEYRPEYLAYRHLQRMCVDAGLGFGPTRSRIAALAQRAPRIADRVREEITDEGRHRPVLDRICEVVRERSRLLLEQVTARP
ncbi:type II toxin-antitoxin system HipA family toxin [Patulibacter sp. NPDC049589]|uniref:type II toxin-antitoxin system HipA family toxin n=1 Tax=Patulibacter sp. NPDC049589 TaxID=3154731 RepID=UPI003437C901